MKAKPIEVPPLPNCKFLDSNLKGTPLKIATLYDCGLPAQEFVFHCRDCFQWLEFGLTKNPDGTYDRRRTTAARLTVIQRGKYLLDGCEYWRRIGPDHWHDENNQTWHEGATSWHKCAT